MTTEQAIELLKAQGFRISKPKASTPKADRPLLNAVGKPLSPLFDPNYRMKHKTSTAHLFKPYGRYMRWVGAAALALAVLSSDYSHAAEMHCGKVRCAVNGIMTFQGRFAVVRVNPTNDRFACWTIHDTYAAARAELASASKR